MSTYYFKGEAKWAKVVTPVDKYNKEEGTEYSINVKLDDDSLELFRRSGSQLRENKKDKGFYTFRRPTRKIISGDIREFGPPVLVDANNADLILNRNEELGNGSIVTVKVEIYNTAKGKGHQLEAVRVEELKNVQEEILPNDEMVPF